MGTLTEQGRGVIRKVMTPPARLLLRARVSPDAITVVGTVAASAVALYFLPRGMFWQGVVIVGLFTFFDALDGTMARLSGRASDWGAFLDSTLDRITDAAIFIGIALFYAQQEPQADVLMVAACALALVGSLLVSYARARAESLGYRADVGFGERTERLVILGVFALLASWQVVFMEIGIWVLAAVAWVTVAQRMVAVRRQVLAKAP
ncbi:MAG: CDP-alcohol phosphatidyltransferase family protein [Actinomycetes bacterium]